MPLPLVPMAIGASGLLGGLLSKSQRGTMDPNMLRALFGPQAIGKDTNELFALLSNSPMFQAMMQSAGMRGQATGAAANRRMARAGVAGGGGVSGVGAWMQAAGRQAGANAQIGARGDIYGQALQAAMQNMEGRMGLWGKSQLMQQASPTWGQQVGGSLLGAAGAGLAAYAGRPSAGRAKQVIGTGPSVPTAPPSEGGEFNWPQFEDTRMG